MKDEELEQDGQKARDVSRRDFVAMSVAAGVATAAGVASAQRPVSERNVEIKTPDAATTPAATDIATKSRRETSRGDSWPS